MFGWRIVYYLFQFYLFAITGALSYLCLRAWAERTTVIRKKEDTYRSPRWTHFVRGVGFLFVASSAIVCALKQTTPITSNLVEIAFVLVNYLLLPRLLKREKLVLIGTMLILTGQAICLAVENHLISSTEAYFVRLTGLVLSSIGFTFFGIRLPQTIMRIKVTDRLVITFAIFSLIVAQLVLLLVVTVLSSLSVDVSGVLDNAEKTLVLSISAVMVISALIGYFIARDLLEPVKRLGAAIRYIGEGKFDHRISPNKVTSENEIDDLIREVNRMADQLKAAEDMRTDFLSFVSHELRSPLTSIQGFITTLESVKDFTDFERTEIHAIIHEETDRLLRMINELLDLSRIQSGKPLTLNKEWFDVVRHLQKIVGIKVGESSKHTIDLIVPEDPVWIQGDPDKIDQIVINLMSNAIKYSPEGGKVTLKLLQNETSVVISVQDEGIGMTDEQTMRVFDKYYRVSEQTGVENQNRLRRIEGSGIGLYLTKALVDAHSGEITVSSKLGVGSCFTVILPKTNDDQTLREISLIGVSRSELLDSSQRTEVPHLLVGSSTVSRE